MVVFACQVPRPQGPWVTYAAKKAPGGIPKGWHVTKKIGYFKNLTDGEGGLGSNEGGSLPPCANKTTALLTNTSCSLGVALRWGGVGCRACCWVHPPCVLCRGHDILVWQWRPLA